MFASFNNVYLLSLVVVSFTGWILVYEHNFNNNDNDRPNTIHTPSHTRLSHLAIGCVGVCLKGFQSIAIYIPNGKSHRYCSSLSLVGL